MKPAATPNASYTLNLTDGPIVPTLVRFSVPFMLSMLLQSAYSTTDTIIVGQFLGSKGLAAVANGSQLMQMLYTVCTGFSSAGQVLIAQARGAKKSDKLQRIVGTMVLLNSALSIGLGLLCIIFSNQLLTLLSVPQEAFVQARLYIIICGAGMWFTGLYNMFSALFRGLGDSKHPLLFVFIATIMNVFLDLLFIGVFHWNVAGAALATILGQLTSVIFCVLFLLRNGHLLGLDFSVRALRTDKETALQFASIGVPMAVQVGAVQISFLFVAKMINGLGVSVSAAFGVMQKLRSLPNYIVNGFSLGASSMMAQNFGAKKLDRVSRIVRFMILFSTICYTICASIFLFFPVPCFRLFTQDSTVLAYASTVTLALAIEAPASFFMAGCNGLVSAQGFVKMSFIVSMLDAFVGRIFFCWFFGSFLGMSIFGYFLGYISGTYVTASIVLVYYLSGLWKKRAALV